MLTIENETNENKNINMKKRHGLIKSNQSKLSLMHRISDILIVFFSLVLSCWIYDAVWRGSYTTAVVFAACLLVMFSTQNDLYRSWRVFGVFKELLLVFAVWFYVVTGLLLLAFMFKATEDYSRLVISTWFVLAPLMMSISRFVSRNVLHFLRNKGWNSRSAAVLGANEQGLQFAKTLNNARWMGLKFVGFYDDRALSRVKVKGINEITGRMDDLIASARSGQIDSIYITMPLRAEARTQEFISRLADTTVSLYYVPDFHSLDILHGSWATVGDSAVISIFESPFHGVDGWLKRLEDIVLASCVLLVVAVPMLLIAACIKFTSPGSVISKQRRYGINGQEIEIWKFRSMTVREDDSNLIQTQRCDVRTTPLGAFLREHYRSEIHRYLRHKVKPGITGWAQVNGWRGETDTLDTMQKRADYDLEYVRNWSLFFDFKIFFMTFFNSNASQVGVRRKDAHPNLRGK